MTAEPATPAVLSSKQEKRNSGLLDLALFVLLTLIVWGLFAFDHGLWQDDALRLSTASEALHGGDVEWFDPGVMPSRRLLPLTYVAVFMTGRPIVLLTLLYGLAWLANGALAAAVGREMFDDDSIGFLAGCLTLTATSDFLTNSLVALGYTASMAIFLGALLLALRYVRSGGSGRFWGSAALLAGSIWMTDIGLIPLCLTPLILWVARPESFRRTVRLTALWVATAIPYAAAFVEGLRYSDYSKVAFLPLTPTERIIRAIHHFAYNFTPWRWAFSRPEWFREPPPILPTWLYAGATLAGVSAFLLVALRRNLDEPSMTPSPAARIRWILLALLTACAFGTNFAYSGINASEAFYRTHLGSRVWISLAIAALIVDACARLAGAVDVPRRKVWPLALLASLGFVAPGIWGGIERQDFFLASWRRHVKELRSLREAIPALRPEARVVLWQPVHDSYLATDARYLALAWMRLLYGRWPADQLWQRSVPRKSVCVAYPEGIRCNTEGCLTGEECWSPVLPWESLVIARFDPRDGSYHLARSLPDDLVGVNSTATGRYAPDRMIVPRPGTAPVIDELLAGDRFLGRWIRGEQPRFDNAHPVESLHLEFDEAITYGTGWEPHVEGRTEKWMLEPVATLQFPIVGQRDLCVTAAISYSLATDITESLTLTANGTPVPLQRGTAQSRTIFSGVVPAGAVPLHDSSIELDFKVNRLVTPVSLGINGDARPLGLLFDWLDVKPCAARSVTRADH